MASFSEQFRKARLKSIPLIGVHTLDAQATIATLTQASNGAPVLVWDCIRGVNGFNDAGRNLMRDDQGFRELDPTAMANPVEALIKAGMLPPHSILFLINGHMLLKEAGFIQALWNLRDLFKQDRRTLVILGPSFTLPPELAQDVVMLEEGLPDTAQLAAIVIETYTAATMTKPKDALILKAVDAIRGLPSFTAEQVCAMALEPDGLDLDALWEFKRQMIENTGFLTVHRGTETSSDVKGADNLIEYLEATMEGDPGPACLAFIDEIDKDFSGMGNDQDSTSKEMIQKFLKWCDRKDSKNRPLVFGVLLLGPAGTGKTMISQVIGRKYEKPTIVVEFAGMKDSLVGQSQQNVAHAFKTINAVAGDKPVLLLATCNSIAVLPPEVRRRFNFGIFFVDLPDAETKVALWKQYIQKFDLPKQDTPDDTGWTGAEIRNCCMVAKQQKTTLKKAATRIVPISESASEQIEGLRKTAHNRYVSAAKPGKYQAPGTANNSFPTTTTRRAISTKN